MYKELNTFFILLASLLVGCAHVNHEAEVQNFIERQKVEDVVNRLFIETDGKNWSAVRALFTDEVDFDMSSLTGAPLAKLPSEKITDMWDKGLKLVEQVHHQSGNFLTEINGLTAKVYCYGTATHFKNPHLKNRVTSFVGSYNLQLVKINNAWKISALRFNKKYVE